MTKDEALKMALEALEGMTIKGRVPPTGIVFSKAKAAHAALREALAAQPAPVQGDMPKIGCVNHDCEKCKAIAAQQEPVAWGNLANWCLDSDRVLITDKTEAEKYRRDVYDLTPLYTTPPAARRPWVGLTAEEWREVWLSHEAQTPTTFAEDIEAKLKEKNT